MAPGARRSLDPKHHQTPSQRTRSRVNGFRKFWQFGRVKTLSWIKDLGPAKTDKLGLTRFADEHHQSVQVRTWLHGLGLEEAPERAMAPSGGAQLLQVGAGWGVDSLTQSWPHDPLLHRRLECSAATCAIHSRTSKDNYQV